MMVPLFDGVWTTRPVVPGATHADTGLTWALAQTVGTRKRRGKCPAIRLSPHSLLPELAAPLGEIRDEPSQVLYPHGGEGKSAARNSAASASRAGWGHGGNPVCRVCWRVWNLDAAISLEHMTMLLVRRYPLIQARWLVLLIAPLLATGCVSRQFRAENTQAVITQRLQGEDDDPWVHVFTNLYLYPVGDFFAGHWILEARNNGRAWNLDSAGNVPDGSFYVNRNLADLPAERFDDPWGDSVPQMPLKVTKRKRGGESEGFIGKDARGRTYMVKFDDSDFPELSSASEAIGGRIAWAMGYHVPACHVVTVEGTGKRRYDGRRGVAIAFVPGEVLDQWRFQHLKYRREIRAYKVVAMWMNEIDHGDNNTLLTWDGQQMTYWLLDFNCTLGCWQGEPKEPQMGWVQYWDPPWQLRMILSLGLVRPRCDPNQPVVSTAVGRFDERLDVRQWRTRQENPAYNHLRDEDARWMVERMNRLSEAQLAAIVRAGRYSNPKDEAYVLKTLLARRTAIAAGFASQGDRK